MADRAPRSRYVHGSEPAEQARLGLMNEILNRRSIAELALQGGERILDVGCGLATFSREMARAAGEGSSVVAVERDERQIAAAREALRGDPRAASIDLRSGDAHALPLAAREWGSFDLAFARFLLEHVPDPERVVAEMVRAVRPGGRIVLCDDDHDLLRLDPETPEVERLWRAYVETYRAAGNDPFVGRRLPRLLHGAGADLSRCTAIFFGSCAGSGDWRLVIDNCRGIFTGARGAILAHLAASEFDRALAAYDAWSRRPDASFWLPLAWAEGTRR
jgi:ubiquinone/menaquinone biosynthesis C-methylase UbiE